MVPAIFADYHRPYLIVSTNAHPYPDEHIGLAITTTSTPDTIRIADSDWAVGSLPESSHLKPWKPTILKAAEVDSVAGALRPGPVDRAAGALATLCGVG